MAFLSLFEMMRRSFFLWLRGFIQIELIVVFGCCDFSLMNCLPPTLGFTKLNGKTKITDNSFKGALKRRRILSSILLALYKMQTHLSILLTFSVIKASCFKLLAGLTRFLTTGASQIA